MDYAQEVSAITAHKAILGKRLIDGESLVDLTKEYPELVFKFKDIQMNVQAFFQAQVPILPRCQGFIPNSFGQILTVSECKQRHYWFWSETPNKGKLRFLGQFKTSFLAFGTHGLRSTRLQPLTPSSSSSTILH